MQQMRKWIGLMIIMVMALAAPLVAQADHGDDGAFDWKGTIDSRPAGVAGTWVIGGREFQATASTQIEEEFHALDVGSCAKVNYNIDGTTNIAVKIQDEEASHCANGGGGGGDDGEHISLYARMDAAPPADIHNGEWHIGGSVYTSNNNTSFDFSNGNPTTGTCVEIEYDSATPTVLRSLGTEPDFKCDAGNGTPPDQPTTQVYGVLDEFPAALVGTWVVSGTAYIANTATRFEQEHGGFFNGVCVKVKFQTANGENLATEIDVAEAYHCGSGGSEPVEEKLYALIDTVPATYTTAAATWTIGGAEFSSNPATTDFEEEHGTLAAGACAEVEFYTDNGAKIATKIATEEPYKCNTNTFTNKVYGKVVTAPDGLYGSWVISSTHAMTATYNAGSYTTFEPNDNSAYPAGQCVKVVFFVENGVNKAIKIEAENIDDCGGHDGSGTPSLPEHSKVYALLESFPAGGSMLLGGEWHIGGETYIANPQTEYRTEHGDFAVNACVKAKYYVDATGNKILIEVETENPEKCQSPGSSDDAFKAYGAIEAMPGIFNSPGTWVISGVTYQTTAATQYEQEHGFFTTGAFVEVIYHLVGGIKTALKIETHVAPHAGLGDVTGSLDGRPDINGDGWDDWQVDGQNYYSDHAIEVDASLLSNSTGRISAPNGTQVALNTYLGIDGKTYVTFATAVHQIYLPLVLR